MFVNLVQLVAALTAVVLLVFNLRRLFFTLTILLLGRKGDRQQDSRLGVEEWPCVLVLAPSYNEEHEVEGLCQALSGLDYPTDRLSVVLIDDGSRDSSRELMERFAAGRPNWKVLALPTNLGKASALNAALAKYSFGDFIFIFDADHRPQPSALKRAMRYYEDPRVAGVSGRTLPRNALASASAYYSAVESHIHQMVTMRAKDRLGLAPALLGSNCSYRRTALEQCRGFRNGVLLEDTDATLSYYRAGFLVRFAEDAIAFHEMPETVKDYLSQHLRWGRGFYAVTRAQALPMLGNSKLSLPLRIELLLFLAGYLDRPSLALGGIFMVLSYWNSQSIQFPMWVGWLAVLTPAAEIIALFAEQRMPVSMWLRLPLMPIYFVLDILTGIRAAIGGLFGRTSNSASTGRSTSRDATIKSLQN